MKLDLYQAAQVAEYLAVLLFEREIRWHMPTNGVYQRVPPDADGSWRSRVVPGLWLDGQALLAGDMPRVLAKLQEGIRSPKHDPFVDKLVRTKQ